MMQKRMGSWSTIAVAWALVCSALLTGSMAARADKSAAKKAAAVKLAQRDVPGVETLRVTMGSQITLPLENVTRVLPRDEEIVRPHFQSGQVVLEGITTGVTIVDVEQGTAAAGNLRRQQYEVEVLKADALPAPATSTPAPAPVIALGNEPPATATATITTPDTVMTPLTPTVEAVTTASTPVSTARNITVSLAVEPAEDNPSQAVFTLIYGNPTASDARHVMLRYALDDNVSYVTASATGGARYEAAARELVWSLGTLPAGITGKSVSFRIAPLDPTVDRFFSAASIESENGPAIGSNTLEYSFTPTPLLTVFALPDRILEGHSGTVLLDVRGTEYQTAIDRLVKMGIVKGTTPTTYNPATATQRAEYTVLVLRGLNLKDLRDMSAIKFVLSRHATVNLDIRNAANRVVAGLVKNMQFNAGEHTVLWDGRTNTGFAVPGRYAYTCSARDAKGITTTLRGYIHVVPQTPLQADGNSTFLDVRPNDWYAGFIGAAEKQGVVKGYPNGEFRPRSAINRVEATAIVVRAMGLEDLARTARGKDAGFLDDHLIPDWATGYVYVASTVAKTSSGKLIVGYPSNMYQPLKAMRRDEAALVVQRLVDKETNRKLYISGQLVPGATVTINSRAVAPADDGSFSFILDQNSAEPTSVAVVDRRH